MNILNSSAFSKVLIIRLSSMGDILLTSALVRMIKSKYPNIQLDFALANSFFEIYKFNPYISNLFEYDKSKYSNEQEKDKKIWLKSADIEKYDLIIDLQKNIRSYRLSKGIYNNISKIKKNRINKLSLKYFKKPSNNNIIQIPDIYAAAAAPLELSDDGLGLEIWLPKDIEQKTYTPHSRQSEIGDKLKIAIAPGAHHFTKRWPAEKFAELINLSAKEYDAEFLLLGGPKDSEICAHIKSAVERSVNDCSGSKSIIETAEYLDECSLLITNDTGVMHIAAARQVPICAIFGSTVREFGFAPYRVKHEIVEKNLKCRPCTHIGRANCPKKHFDCMNKISPLDIMSSMERLLDKSP